MQHGKTIRNKTGLVLDVRFDVRNGTEPFTEPGFGAAGTRIGPGEETFLGYGDDANPFLDAVTASVSWSNGSAENRIGAGSHRGSDGDTAMNTNDTVTVSFENQQVGIAFSNGG